MWNAFGKFYFVSLLLALVMTPSLVLGEPRGSFSGQSRDEKGREIIRGPVGNGSYINVHIISDSVGIQGQSVMVVNSIIEAPVCIRAGGQGAIVSNNSLLCNLCIEFTDRVLVNNILANNRCSGKGTNRPDVFGW